MSNSFIAVDECSSSRKCTDHIYTLIGLKCQSMRSKVHCTNKTLHKSRKNVKDHASPRVACTENLTASITFSNTLSLFPCMS